MTVSVVQTVHIDETGDSYYRMRWPGMQLAAQDKNFLVINLDSRSEDRIKYAEAADLLVIYQSSDVDLLPIFEKRRALGKKTLVEYNDNFYFPPAASPVSKAWSSPLIWQIYEAFIKESDGIIVTGPGLKELFSEKFQKDILVLENHLPNELPDFDSFYANNPSEIAIGWAGSLGHVPDLLAVMPVLHELMQENKKIVFHLMGNETLPSIVGLPADRVRFTNWGTMQQYYDFWKPVQIGLAPLIDHPYNRCRSDIKAVEMAGAGVLPILTDLLPYKNFISKTSLPSFRNHSELKEILQKYINDPSSLKTDASNAFKYVSAERIGPRNTDRLKLYQSYATTNHSQFKWPAESGYHEIAAKSSARTSTQKCISEYEPLIKEKKYKEAKAFIFEQSKLYPYNPDIQFLFLQALGESEDALAEQTLNSISKIFPDDLRVLTVRAQRARSHGAKLELWAKVIYKLNESSEAYRRFYITEIQIKFVPMIRTHEDYINLAEKFLNFYPDSAALRLELGEAYIRKEQYTEAHEQFRWLSRSLDEFQVNQRLFAEVQPSYIKAIEESLVARKLKKLS